MIIYFVEIDSGEQALFQERLSEYDLVAVPKLEDVGADAEIVSVFISQPLDDAFLAAHPHLRLIAARSTSLDYIDLAACAARGVPVCHVPHYGETTVAEHTFTLILSLARRLREVMELSRSGQFSYETTRGFELHGKTLGIIGMGRVGQRVVPLARAFQMQVIAYDPEPAPSMAQTLHFHYVSLIELLASADVISLHAKLSPATYHILNRDTLAQTKHGVLVINTARGGLIDTAALREALESGQVGGAGLDVIEDERVMREPVASVIGGEILRHLRSDAHQQETRDTNRLREIEELIHGNALLARSNVVFTPHVAFNSVEAMRRLAETTCENIAAFIAGKPIHLVKI